MQVTLQNKKSASRKRKYLYSTEMDYEKELKKVIEEERLAVLEVQEEEAGLDNGASQEEDVPMLAEG